MLTVQRSVSHEKARDIVDVAEETEGYSTGMSACDGGRWHTHQNLLELSLGRDEDNSFVHSRITRAERIGVPLRQVSCLA